MKTYEVTIGYYTRQVNKELVTTVEASSKYEALGEAVHQLLADGYAITGLEYFDVKRVRHVLEFSPERLAEMADMFEREGVQTYMWGDLT